MICALLACGPAGHAAAEPSPYQARVIAPGASVHSGPGENFYPTDMLTQGAVVEVYREKPGGWLAIRPPAGSFSWVGAGDLTLKDGGLAEIDKNDVASRIGSQLNDRNNAVQVRLKKGETVEVVSQEEINGEKWYKIAPPAGEFRWIQASVLERIGPISATPAAMPPASSPAVAEPKKDTAIVPQPAAPIAAPASDFGVPPLPSATKDADPTATAPLAAAPIGAASSAAPVTGAPNAQPSAEPGVGELSKELAAIELRLSRMAAAPTNLWNTEKLERDTAQLMARAQTPAERDAVRVTQDKINRFAEIGRRAGQTPASVPQVGSPTTPLPNPVAATANGGPYDAVGILRPVVSRRPGAPQFALVDEAGQVVSFVTATPDLNLQPYLGRRVGIVGNRGFIPEFQRSNVTAARVMPLNERIVR